MEKGRLRGKRGPLRVFVSLRETLKPGTRGLIRRETSTMTLRKLAPGKLVIASIMRARCAKSGRCLNLRDRSVSAGDLACPSPRRRDDVSRECAAEGAW